MEYLFGWINAAGVGVMLIATLKYWDNYLDSDAGWDLAWTCIFAALTTGALYHAVMQGLIWIAHVYLQQATNLALTSPV